MRRAEADLGLRPAQIRPVVVVSVRVMRRWGYVPPSLVVLGWQVAVA